MRFGRVHRTMTDGLAVLGLLALLTSGELDPVMSSVIAGSLLGAVVLPESVQSRPGMALFGKLGSLTLLITQFGRLALGGEALTLAVEFAAGLQVIRLATRKGAAHDQQIILLAMLHLVAGTVLGGGLAYGACFVGFLILAPGALVLSHLRREVEGNYRQGARDRTGLPVDVPRILRSRRVISRRFLAFTCSLAIPVFLFTLALFVAFPRVGLSLLLVNHHRSSRMIGFRDKVDLGGVGQLRSDPTVALRVRVKHAPDPPPARLSLYLRGTAFDYYDGRGWNRTVQTRTPALQLGNVAWLGAPGALGEPVLSIDLEPISPPVVFIPGDAKAFRVVLPGDGQLGEIPNVVAGSEGEYRYASSEERGLRYEVFADRQSSLLRQAVSPEERGRYLRLPSEISPRVQELALQWADGKTDPLEIASNIETRLRKEYQYDLNSPSGASDNPLEDFLFVSHRGHCEYYSTALAMLLRTLGIATRNVTGFIGGSYNRFGEFYVVRQGDAHSWVEAYAEGVGWVRFDPTPASETPAQARWTGPLATLRDLVEAASHRWSRHVVGYDLPQQVALWQRVKGSDRMQQYARWGRSAKLAGGVAASFGVLGLGVWALGRWRRRQRPHSPHETKEQLAMRRACGLYEELERVLARQGTARPLSSPPLGFACALRDAGHPSGPEVVALTYIYLEARFGQRGLSEEQERAFHDRVQELGRTIVSSASRRPVARGPQAA